MCQSNRHLRRRDFLRLGGLTVGSAAAATLACGRGSQLVQVTAVPGATGTPRPPLTLTPGTYADTVLTNGNVVTMDAAGTKVEAVAVKDGLIVQVGSNGEIRALVGPNTQEIDLLRRTVTPGLIDAHNHLSVIGLYGTAYIDIQPPGVQTIEQVQDKIAEGCANAAPGEWVIAAGFIAFEGGRLPNKHDLDPVSPNNPVMLVNQGGHLGAVNSYALEMVGVNANTPNPPFGAFDREADGTPSGILINHSAMDVFRRLWPPDILSPEILHAAAINPQAHFASVGVTSFQDVNARGLPRMEAYFDAARAGEMTIRAYVLNTIEYFQELDGRPEAIEGMRYDDAYMRFAGFKFLVDGAGAAAFTHEPHNGVMWNVSTWNPDELNEAVRTLHEAGYQMAFHVVGDAAVDMVLDAVEGAMNTAPRPDPRHRLEHAVFNTDAALQRTKDLGMVVSTQPHFVRLLGDYFKEIMGDERAARMIPTRTWLDLGVPLALGSDAPTTPWWDPQSTLFASIARLTASNEFLSPEQALTIEEAMYAHTMGGAYAAFEENEKGSLEAGKMADLIVWADDPYRARLRDILTLTIDLTMVGGEVVYQA